MVQLKSHFFEIKTQFNSMYRIVDCVSPKLNRNVTNNTQNKHIHIVTLSYNDVKVIIDRIKN